MLALCWLILAYLGSNCPTWLNMASTWAQLSPTWPQLGSNLTPRDPPNLWFSYRKTIVLVFLQFLVKNGIRITLLGGWRGQVGAKLRPCWAKLGPTWGHVGTILAYLGIMLAYLGLSWLKLPNLVPTWLNMASNFAQLCPPWPQLGSNLTPRTLQNCGFPIGKW